MEAIVLAGGLGTRLRSVVPNVAKPMADVAGRPFLAWLLDYWISQGVTRFVLSVGYRYQSVIDYFSYRWKNIPIEYAIEHSPCGTGGGLFLAAQKLQSKNRFLVLNGDTWFAVDLKKFVNFAEQNDADWCFALYKVNSQQRYMGVNLLPTGEIVSLKSESERAEQINGGVYLIKYDALFKYPQSREIKAMISLEDDVFPFVMENKQRMFGISFAADFIDIGLPQDYNLAASVISPTIMEV